MLLPLTSPIPYLEGTSFVSGVRNLGPRRPSLAAPTYLMVLEERRKNGGGYRAVYWKGVGAGKPRALGSQDWEAFTRRKAPEACLSRSHP